MKRYSKFVLLVFLFATMNLFSQWEQLSGLPNAPIEDLLVAKNKIYAVVWDNGLFISSDYGDNWVPQNEGITTTFLKTIALVGNTMLLGASDTSGVFRSTDYGYHWVRSVDSLKERSIATFAVDGDIVYLLTETSSIYKSTDFGVTWWEVNSAEISEVITAIAASNGRLLAGTSTGNLYLSTDDGSNWANIKNQQIYSTITSLLWDGDNIFCGTTSGVYFSSNFGTNWFQRNLGMKVQDILLIRKVKDAIIVGTKTGGVYFSFDEGRNWFEFNEGISNMTIQALTFDNYYIYIGTEYGGVLRRNINEMKLPEVLPPSLRYPPNDAKDIPTSVSFAWDESKGAIGYHILVAKDGSFSQNSIILDRSGITTTFYPSVGLKPNRKYFWKVAAIDYQSQEKWSEVFSFETVFDSVKPELYFPFNNFEISKLPLQFFWSDCGMVQNYQLQVATENNFQNLVVDAITNDTNYSVSSGIENNRTYYWRVVANYNDSVKVASDTFSFRTTVLGVEAETKEDFEWQQTGAKLVIDFKDLKAGELVSVEVFDILGNSVLFGWFESNGGRNLVEMDLTKLTSGLYNFIIRRSTNYYIKSFILVR